MPNKEKSTHDSLSNGNLARLLKTFSKAEMREFEKFVHSPYHNNRSDVTRFFSEVKKYYPDFLHDKLNKKNIYAALYPGLKYKDDIIRRLQSNLFKLGEAYIAHRSLKNNSFEFDKYILDYYYENFIDNLYIRQFKDITAAIEKQPERSSEFYRRVSSLEETNRSYIIKSDPTKKTRSLQKEMDSLLSYSLISLLRLNSLAISDMKQFNKKYNIKYLETILNLAENSGFMNSKVIEMFCLAIEFETTGSNDEIFFKLKKMLEKNIRELETEDKLRFFNCLLSYCYDMKIRPGKDFDKEEFELISRMLEEGLLVVENTIYSEWFMYAFLSAVRAGEIKYAEMIIQKYGTMLPENESSNILNHAYAELSMVKKDHETALKHLALPKYHSVNEKLRANHMYIKIYFELEESEHFFYQVSSFKQLMRNVSSLSKDTGIIPRTNFIKFTEKLFRIKLGEIKIPVDELRREIMNSKILGNKWLLDKLDGLEKRKD